MLSSRVRARNRKLATETRIYDAAQPRPAKHPLLIIDPVVLHVHIAPIGVRTRDATQTEFCRIQERATNVIQRLLAHRAGVLATALSAAERTHVGEEHHDGDGLLSLASSVSGAALAQWN